MSESNQAAMSGADSMAFVKVNRRYLEVMATDVSARLPLATRVLFLAQARLSSAGHAHFDNGELEHLLTKIKPDTGEITNPTARGVNKAIETLIEAGAVDPGSCRACITMQRDHVGFLSAPTNDDRREARECRRQAQADNLRGAAAASVAHANHVGAERVVPIGETGAERVVPIVGTGCSHSVVITAGQSVSPSYITETAPEDTKTPPVECQPVPADAGPTGNDSPADATADAERTVTPSPHGSGETAVRLEQDAETVECHAVSAAPIPNGKDETAVAMGSTWTPLILRQRIEESKDIEYLEELQSIYFEEFSADLELSEMLDGKVQSLKEPAYGSRWFGRG